MNNSTTSSEQEVINIDLDGDATETPNSATSGGTNTNSPSSGGTIETLVVVPGREAQTLAVEPGTTLSDLAESMGLQDAGSLPAFDGMNNAISPGDEITSDTEVVNFAFKLAGAAELIKNTGKIKYTEENIREDWKLTLELLEEYKLANAINQQLEQQSIAQVTGLIINFISERDGELWK